MEKNGTLASPATARADEQNALGNAAAQALKLLGLAQELNDLLELFLGFVNAGDILEGNLLLLHGEQTGARFAEGHRLVSAGLHLAHHEHEEAEQQKDWQGGDDGLEPEALGIVLDLVVGAVFPGRFVDVGEVALGEGGGKRGVIVVARLAFVLCGDFGAVGNEILYLPCGDVILELGQRDGDILTRAGRLGHIFPEEDQHREKRCPEKELFDG
jgi:hypothetical protein